jgi:hypothetical protein
MNRIGMLIVSASLVLSPAVLQGQDHAAAGPASQHTTHKPQGFADYALGKINPNDTDYGAALDAARGATVKHTMDDLYFWSNVVALILLSGVITVFLFHLRAADKKEIMAATLIAQLWNGRVSDRTEIERRTEQYNNLVDEHNAVVERELMARSQPAPSEDQGATDLKRSVENLDSRAKAGTLSASAGSQNRLDVAPSDTPVSAVGALNQQQRTVLLERRIEAMKSTEQNLKERLNQTSALLEQERQRNQALKGA